MATTTVAIGKVELSMRKNQSIPEVWGVDKTGKPSTDPKKVYEEGGLLPLGGTKFGEPYPNDQVVNRSTILKFRI